MEKKLTACMIDDFIVDPVLAAKVIFNIRATPRDEIRWRSMWTNNFVIDNSAAGQGKGLAMALISALRAMLMPERTELMHSITFVQIKLVHEYHWRWARNCPIYANELRRNREQRPDMTQSTDYWQEEFENGSIIRSIPADWKGQAERVASEDATDLYSDEVTKYPDYDLFWRQFATRLRRPLPEEQYEQLTDMRPMYDDPIFGRHHYMGGTPRFTWHPLYRTVERIQKDVRDGLRGMDYISFCYKDLLPFVNNPNCPGLAEHLNIPQIKKMEREMSRSTALNEIYGEWTSESDDYYPQDAMKSARVPEVRVMTERAAEDLWGWGNMPSQVHVGGWVRTPQWVYVLGVDPSTGGSLKDIGNIKDADDAAFHVLRARLDSNMMQSVFAFRLIGARSPQASHFIHELDSRFHFDLIMMDPNGGGINYADCLQNVNQTDEGDKKLKVTPLISMGDERLLQVGSPRLCLFGAKDPRLRGDAKRPECPGMGLKEVYPESILIFTMHDGVKAAFEHGDIQAPPQSTHTENFEDPDMLRAELIALDQSTMGERSAERIAMEIDLAYMQLGFVGKVLDKTTRQPKTDQKGLFEWKSPRKKDAAYAMCYAYMGVRLLRHEFEKRTGVAKLTGRRRPMAVASFRGKMGRDL